VADTMSNATIVGGTAAVSDAVKTAADAIIGSISRVAGNDRFETARDIADTFYNGTYAPQTIGVATGLNYADALTGGAASGQKHRPLILVRTSDVPAPTVDFASDNSGTIYGGDVYGGTAAITDGVKAYLESLI
jgi:putative cell wall-binding protein